MTDLLQKPVPVLDLSPEIAELWSELNAAFQRVLNSGQFIMGPEVTAFEREVAEYLGAKHAIGVNSGTDALIIGLRALDIGAGDEVITTPFSFFATAEAISNVGATPVFVDIQERTFNLAPELIEAAITPSTKAILPVHLYGRPANMNAIVATAEKHGLKVIEDCAQSFGATIHGQRTGTIGHLGAYSFFPSKNLGGYGDGGLIVTNDHQIAEKASMLRAHGARTRYHNEVLGYNSRLDALQAALLRVKLPLVDAWNHGRRQVARRYNEMLGGVGDIITPEMADGHVFHQYTIRITNGGRDAVHHRLSEAGIATMIYYPIPQDRLPVYAGKYPRLSTSDTISMQVLSLPIWPRLEEDLQGRIVGALIDALPH